MGAIVLDGKALAKQIESELTLRVQKITQLTGRVPALATILVGDDPASEVYVTKGMPAGGLVCIQENSFT